MCKQVLGINKTTLVSQLTFTCSKSITETLEKGVGDDDVVLVFLLLTLKIFHTFF